MKCLLVLLLMSIWGIEQSIALNPLVIKGYKFFDTKTGVYFPVKGVAYYPRPNTGLLDKNSIDYFTNEYSHIWVRDIKNMKEAGINTIRIYAVDPSKNHDRFMCALSSAGIYAIIGVAASCEGCAIGKEPTPTCYSADLKTRGEMIVNAFAKYDNTLGFSAGNEVNHVVPKITPEKNGICQKKFIRDLRFYISKCPNMRKIPVGVVLADTQRSINAKYYNCLSDPADKFENAEWYGLNPYLACDGSITDSSKLAGYKKLLEDFESYKYSIPVILTEYGCVNPSFPPVGTYKAQRTFLQSELLYTKAFREYFSGGVVFEYSTELANSQSTSPYPFTAYGPQNYGLGYFSPKECDDIKTKCVYNRMPNYDNLAKKYKAVTTAEEESHGTFSPANDRISRSTCPAQFKEIRSFTWAADSRKSLACTTATTFSCFGVKTTAGSDSSDGSTAGSKSSGSKKKSGDASPSRGHLRTASILKLLLGLVSSILV